MVIRIFSVRSILALGLLAVSCVSSPTYLHSTEKRSTLHNRALATSADLRILPLGDSITWGTDSSDGNGYRLDLYNMLSGNTVRYIGSLKSGTMTYNQNEGHSGAVINEIASYAPLSLPKRPNVVLLMAGTNDVNKGNDPSGAPVRLGLLIDQIITACPDAAILVAQITPIADAAVDALAVTYNQAIPGVVKTRTDQGSHVLVVNMRDYVPVADLSDGLHPNDAGYKKMAEAWEAGLEKAAELGWITEPVTVTSTECDGALYWDSEYGKIASGVGSGDVAFSHSWSSVGALANGNVGSGTTQGVGVRLADMDGDGLDDYLWVDPTTGAITLYLNGGYTASGGINWISKGKIASGLGDGPGVMFADLNGDGKADYLWVDTNGDVTAYKNGGENSAGGWTWTSLGRIVHGTGATRATTRFADIDGDGRAEYLIVGSTGALTAWFNSGYADTPSWVSMGTIASGIGDTAGVYLEDLNGDGKADYIWLDSNGAATAYINNRGANAFMAPKWVSAGTIASGVETTRDNIIFGDLNGDGKKDYVYVHADTGKLEVWLNTGSGGAFVTGDGTRFADMDGDGLDDYMFINEAGAITLYLNSGWDSSASKWVWVNQGEIATGVAARKDIRMADLDGDGLADYLVVDEKTGAVTFWRNGGPDASKSGGWSWENLGQVATGLGAGAGVQFADIDGDGKADYLWVDTNGAVTAYLNGGSSSSKWIWTSQGIIATGVGGSRQDIQFHDINGDGRADYLWVNRLDGSVQEWENGGAKTGGGWLWTSQGQIASGVGANGYCTQFADTTGTGRADYLNVVPSSGAVLEWWNGCTGGTSSDTTTTLWQTATCSDSNIADSSLNQAVRWNAADASGAWAAVVANWTADPTPGASELSFIEEVSRFFGGVENMNCGSTVENNGCTSAVALCSTNVPAGALIINSLVQINDINLNFYAGVDSAYGDMDATITEFSSIFAPIKDESAVEKMILDFVGLGFALMASPVWNVALKSLPYFKANANLLGTIKDSVNPMVSNGITITKDTSLSGGIVDVETDLATSMRNMVQAWYSTIEDVNKQLFDGSTTSVTQLGRMITGGQLMEQGDTLTASEIRKYIEQSMYIHLIPQAWSLSNKGYYPFILDSKSACDTDNPLPDYMSDSTATASSVCFNNVLYFLVSASGDYRSCTTDPCTISDCVNNKFTTLPGLSELDGTSTSWGGLTPADFVNGSLAGYTANGNSNGWPAADSSSSSTIDAIYDTGIHTPGVVMLPICDATAAFDGWATGDTSDSQFPCQTGGISAKEKRKLRAERELREKKEEKELAKRVCLKH